MDYARSLFKSLVGGQNVHLHDKQKSTAPQPKSADGVDDTSDVDSSRAVIHNSLVNMSGNTHVPTPSKVPETALANAASNPPPGNYMTMSGHGHGGRADHDVTPSHSQQVLITVL